MASGTPGRRREPRDALNSRRNAQTPLHRGPGHRPLQPTRHVVELVPTDQLACAVEADEIAHPAERRNVGDRIVLAHDPAPAGDPLLQNAEQPRGFLDVAFERTLVLVFAAGELVEE